MMMQINGDYPGGRHSHMIAIDGQNRIYVFGIILLLPVHLSQIETDIEIYTHTHIYISLCIGIKSLVSFSLLLPNRWFSGQFLIIGCIKST
jgi:hypothetical protein